MSDTVMPIAPTCSTTGTATSLMRRGTRELFRARACCEERARPSAGTGRRRPAQAVNRELLLSFASFHSLQQVIAHAQRVGHDCERRIHSAARGKEARINDVKIVEFVCFTISVEC